MPGSAHCATVVAKDRTGPREVMAKEVRLLAVGRREPMAHFHEYWRALPDRRTRPGIHGLQTLAHASRHKAARFRMTIEVVRPNHRVPSAVRSIHYGFIRHVGSLTVDADAIVTILAIPIGIVEALGITAIATRSLAAVRASNQFVNSGCS